MAALQLHPADDAGHAEHGQPCAEGRPFGFGIRGEVRACGKIRREEETLQNVNVALVAVIKQGAPAADGIGNAVVLNDAQNAWHKQNARDAEAEHGFEREQEEIFDRDVPAAGEQTHKEVDDRECHHADEEIIIHDARGGDHERKNAAALCVHVFIERG